jgi:hypothetical protein
VLQRLKHFIIKSRPSAFGNRVFLKIWVISLTSSTAVAAHDTAATWMMNLMSPSGLFISLMASLAALPFFLFTLPAGALADAVNEAKIGSPIFGSPELRERWRFLAGLGC